MNEPLIDPARMMSRDRDDGQYRALLARLGERNAAFVGHVLLQYPHAAAMRYTAETHGKGPMPLTRYAALLLRVAKRVLEDEGRIS